MPPVDLSGRRGPIGSRAMPPCDRLSYGDLSRLAGAPVRARWIRREVCRPFRKRSGVYGSVRVSEEQWLVEVEFDGDSPFCQGEKNK